MLGLVYKCILLTAVEKILLEQLKVDHLTAVVQSLSTNRAQDQQPPSNEHNQILPISTLEELNTLDESRFL